MILNLKGHHLEQTPARLKKLFAKYDNADHKTAVWNHFVDAPLTDVTGADCAILPRVLPASYLPVIKKTAKDITTFALRLLSLPADEIKAIVPRGPIRDFLIEELGVLRHRNGRITGSFRFDMAIVGDPSSVNPPKLLEINEIGFDGLARSSFIQDSMFRLIPELRSRVFALDTASAEIRNMSRLGRKIARIQYDSYNWDEEHLIAVGREHGVDVSLISPSQFRLHVDNDEFPLLKKTEVKSRAGRVTIDGAKPDAVQLSFAFELEDYLAGRNLYADIVRSKTPQYGPFLSGLVAAKMILVLLDDPALRKKFLGSSRKLGSAILDAFPLKGNVERTLEGFDKFVLKHTDGYGGNQVFMGREIPRNLKKIKPRNEYEWVVQERTNLNLLAVNGILSRPRKVISDLGVFVHYDWSRGSFQNFEVGGFITRATNKSWRVNVSGGGIQVPVMFLKDR
ncbi:MAG: hypothetical protein V4760_09930 [Bdellovibrionota bacterium]